MNYKKLFNYKTGSSMEEILVILLLIGIIMAAIMVCLYFLAYLVTLLCFIGIFISPLALTIYLISKRVISMKTGLIIFPFLLLIYFISLSNLLPNLISKDIHVQSEDVKVQSEDLYKQGQTFKHQGNYKKAIEYYDKALAINPKNADIWNSKAWLLYKNGKNEEAMTCVNKSLELAPDDSYALDTKACILSALGRYEEALMYFDRALRINPSLTNSREGKRSVLKALKRKKHSRSMPGECTSDNGYMWPIIVEFTSFNKDRNTIKGTLTWPTLNSINKIEGYISDGTLYFEETEYVKRGDAILNCVYTVTYNKSKGIFKGTWYTKGHSGRHWRGSLWFRNN